MMHNVCSTGAAVNTHDAQVVTVGDRIRTRRLEMPAYRSSQRLLAEAVGVRRESVTRWELDQAVPTGPYLTKLAEVLEVTEDWIIQGGDAQSVRLSRLRGLIEGLKKVALYEVTTKVNEAVLDDALWQRGEALRAAIRALQEMERQIEEGEPTPGADKPPQAGDG